MNLFSEKLSKSGLSGALFSFMIITYVIITFLGQSVLLLVTNEKTTVYLAVCSLFSIIALAVSVLFFKFQTKQSIMKVSKIKKCNPIYILIALLVTGGMVLGFGFINSLIANGIESIGGKVSNYQLPVSSVGNYILFSVLIGILPAIFEEVFFRACLPCFSNAKRDVFMVIAVSFSFAIYHFSIVKFAYQFIFGIVLVALVRCSKSTVPTVVAHFLNNFALLTLEFCRVEINLFDPKIIAVGIAVFLFAIALLVIFERLKKRGKKVQTQNQKSEVYSVGSVKEYLIFGSFGMAISLVMIICGAFVI